jgi:hypothetical protein
MRQKQEAEKKIVPTEELIAIHNQLLMTHPTGEDIISIANCIIITRHLMTMPSKREEPKKESQEKEDPKEEPPKPADHRPEKKQK